MKEAKKSNQLKGKNLAKSNGMFSRRESAFFRAHKDSFKKKFSLSGKMCRSDERTPQT